MKEIRLHHEDYNVLPDLTYLLKVYPCFHENITLLFLKKNFLPFYRNLGISTAWAALE